MTTAREQLSWQPSPLAARRMLSWFALGGALIGVVGFAVSFWSVAHAAEPYLGWAAWTLPTLVDLGIFVLSGLSLFLELHEISSKWIRMIPTALAGFTVYLNTAEQHTWFGKAVHSAGPALWIAVVEIATYTVRRLVGLTSGAAMEKVRFSRWLLAPLSTFRLWRRMRLWEVTDYRVAIGREHERSASLALLRQWYGRAWRARAPRGERLAVRLQGVTAEPVAELLTRASAGITAAAAAAVKPVPDTAQQGAEVVSEPMTDRTLMPLDPVLYPAGERRVLSSFAPPNAQRIAFQPLKALTATGDDFGNAWNDLENDENERDTAIRMRADGSSFGEIADRLGRSKSWAYRVAGHVEHANGHTLVAD